MENPDSTKFIFIIDHKAALVDQQAAFDEITNSQTKLIAEKDAIIAEKDAIIAARDARIASALVAKDQLLAAAQDPNIDLNQLAGSIIAEAERTETEKRKDALAAEIAAKQAELNALVHL
jgi:hypothetical protein